MRRSDLLARYEQFPEELKQVPQFVCWAGADKIPKNPHTGGNARSNDRDTWGSFDQAISACEAYGFDGVGFMFAEPYFGVDLDHCLDRSDFVDDFVDTLKSYAEISKSGDGVHIICRGTLPEGRRRKGGVEMYSQGRYFICTGNIYNTAYKAVVDCTESIKELRAKYMPEEQSQVVYARSMAAVSLDDAEIIDKARNAKSGYLFAALYDGAWEGVFPSQSEADLAFCNQLAFWTGRNEAQMDRIFRSSGLMREKWDKRRGEDTYGRLTIRRACDGCREVYNPTRGDSDASLALALFAKKDVPGQAETKKFYDMTDTGNAERFYDRFGQYVRYSFNRKKWYYWTGKCWMLDELGEVKKLADEICADLKREALAIEDDELQDKALKFARSTANTSRKEAMLKEAQHLFEIPAAPDDFDAYSEFLNCENGIINLRNGELTPHDAEMMLTKMCGTEYDVDHARPERWMQFLSEITGDDADLIDYIQRCVGYALTGSNREQCAYFLYGMGNNGKSTFLNALAEVLGSYASNAQPDTIMLQSRLGSSGGGANSDIARLKSTRFVTCEEPTEGVRLNEGLLKQLTGGSKVTCRFLYGDEFEYTPEFKIWVATNHKPVIRGTDVGIWRRIKLIPFEVNIPVEKVDKGLMDKLRAEYPQILAWAVEGCIKWQREGMTEPACVLEATKEYRQEMDLIASFVEQCVIIDYTADKVMARDLFNVYSKWAKENNEYEMSSKKFFTEITKKLPEKGRNGKGIYYTRIKLSEYATGLVGGAHSYDLNRLFGRDQ